MRLDQIRRRVGQMFIVGFEGKSVTEDLKKLIQDYYIGGIILFERNIESPKQIAELTNEIQSLSKTPFFVAIDQEGGKVRRLHPPFTQFGDAPTFAKANSPKLTFEAYQAMAIEMRAVGINYNLAPVVDLNTNPHNPVIGTRAFSDDPETVARIASGAIRGLQRGGVIACAKHFPGHGDTTADSHIELPIVNHSLDRLKQMEWIPFGRVIHGGVESVMTAHILNPNLDPEFPATLSPQTIAYLRNDLRFQKIVIADDLEMEAIASRYPIEEATLKTIGADVDLILICKTLQKQITAIETVLRKVLDIKIPVKRIEQSSERITKVRNRYILPYQPVDIDQVDAIVGCSAHQEIAERLKLF